MGKIEGEREREREREREKMTYCLGSRGSLFRNNWKRDHHEIYKYLYYNQVYDLFPITVNHQNIKSLNMTEELYSLINNSKILQKVIEKIELKTDREIILEAHDVYPKNHLVLENIIDECIKEYLSTDV